jgi:hypothetical protein
MTDQPILRDLGNGLILRHATPADTEPLIALQGYVFRNRDTDEPPYGLEGWTRDLMSGKHPTVQAGDFTVVEDTTNGRLASSLNLISQRWAYEGIEFGVGRPEIVCTHPDYRNRGLVRAQFEVIHEWSAQRGEMVQGITGIPYYYRQFGYEMAMNLGGSHSGPKTGVPKLKEGEIEPFRVRPATEADLPFVAAMDAQAGRRSPIQCVRDAAIWRWELCGARRDNMDRMTMGVVERVNADGSGTRAGCVMHPEEMGPDSININMWEMAPGFSWLAAMPTVLRWAVAEGELQAAANKRDLVGFALSLGENHPAHGVVRGLAPRVNKPYAWYLRVPDLVGFLRHIGPALERRLAESVAVGHTGELRLGFYRSGVRLVFEAGCLVTVEPWAPKPEDGGMAAFPHLTFLRLLFGHCSFDELDSMFADCWAETDATRVLLDALFPKKPARVWPVS